MIVGAGFGGLAAAKRLAGRDVDVTLIDRRNHHVFQPLLYQVATAALSPADIAASDPRDPCRSAATSACVLDEVTRLDAAANAVELVERREPSITTG